MPVNIDTLAVLAQAIREVYHNATIDIEWNTEYVVRIYEDGAAACQGLGANLGTAIAQCIKEFASKFKSTALICEVFSEG